jgi:carboxymethylenebutenolidase
MAALHAGDAPVASPRAQAAVGATAGREVVYGLQGEIPLKGYMAYPVEREEAQLPAIILVHEWWGLNDNIRSVAMQFADQGYRALAVDVYQKEAASNAEEARSMMEEALSDPKSMMDNIRSAYTYLTDEAGSPSVGVVGWCFGGAVSLETALALPSDIDATVIYYGRLVTDSERLATLQMPVIGFFGAEDRGIPVEDVRRFESILSDLEKDAEIHIYEGAGHGFANPSGRSYNEEAANDAWDRTLSFFASHLKVE